MRAAPAVSCAKLCEETHASIQVQRRHSGIPRAMVLRLMPCSPRRRIRLVTVVCGLMARQGPVEPDMPPRTWRQQRASGPHGFAVRVCVVRPARRGPLTGSLPCGHLARRRCRVHHTSQPAFVTIAIRPSCRERTGRAGSADLPDGTSEIFLRGGLDDPNHFEMSA